MASKKKRKQTLASRKAAGRPVVSFTLPTDTVKKLAMLAAHLGKNRSEVAVLAVDTLFDKHLKVRP